jgi:hypothetical protein
MAKALMLLAFGIAQIGAQVALAQVSVPEPPRDVRIDGGTSTGLPAGVTLREIDGGPSYYADHGFSYAVNAGWDDPDFFPIGLWLAPMRSQADADRWKDLNLTAFFTVTGNSNLSLLRSNGFHGVIQAPELPEILAGNGGTLGAETVGLLVYDEPWTVALATDNIKTVANVHQDKRYWYINTTWTWLAYGDIGGVPAPTLLSNLYSTPNGTKRHLDLQSTDIYWFAGGVGVGAYNGALTYGISSMSTDQNNRACHYGDMIDMLREYQRGKSPAPLAVFIENGGPYTENTSGASYIRAAEMNAAVWSTIIHGARYIMYFNHSFAGPGTSNDNLANAYYQSPRNGDALSIYAQTKATNALVRSLASVINSPFADGYVTVSPAPSSRSDFSGFDVMAKRTSTGQFYIFAMPRWSKTLSNQKATFTIKSTGATQVTVVNENRTIPITNGGTQFVDNFETANTVHIYRVD